MKKNMLFCIFIFWNFSGLFAQSAYADCADALLLCSKGNYLIADFHGPGNEKNEAETNTCLGNGFQEKQSAWVKWEVSTAGQLEFMITPLDLNDDIDFVLYRLEKGWSECAKKKAIRCVASGKNWGDVAADYKPCLGPTGIRAEARDVAEYQGCADEDDNFAAPIRVKQGEQYALLIHNYTSAQGVVLELTGDANLQLERELEVIHEKAAAANTYVFQTQIAGGHLGGNQSWSFGEGAEPAAAEGPGPHEVSYTHQGLKIVETQIRTDQGCRLSTVYHLDAQTGIPPALTATGAFHIFPNPTTDKVFVQSTQSFFGNWASVYLIDISGKILEVQAHYLNKEPITLEVSDLLAGAYYIRIETEHDSFFKKLIKL